MAVVVASQISFPLRQITASERRELCEILWSWQFCNGCNTSKSCEGSPCPTQRLNRLNHYFAYYTEITSSYEASSGPGERMALASHEDLFQILRILKSNPNVTRSEVLRPLFDARNQAGEKQASAVDQETAINLAVRILVMVTCFAQRQDFILLESGTNHAKWGAGITFSQFVAEVFPIIDHPILAGDDERALLDVPISFNARKLKKHVKIRFKPTDDLSRHLMLDHKNHVLEIYHHTAFIKEHLRLTKDGPSNLTLSESLKLGALPRQLALETLDSIQKILFPLSDPKSHQLLLSLISSSSFDPDTLRYEAASIRHPHEHNIEYKYFGARLADLYEELQNPKPRGLIEKWLERKSGARYVMMATLVGVLIAVLLGIASLVASIFQAWVAYQQWQHPIAQNG